MALPLPPVELRFMNEDDERFLRQGRDMVDSLRRHGLTDNSRLLDIGSGYGRLATGLAGGGYRGRYTGFDILPRHISWCASNITPAHPNLQFRHINALNERYNPAGTVDPEQVRFPAKDSTVAVACAFSVFTHLYRATIEHYLDELARVLRPGGVAVTSWLLWDETNAAAAASETSTYPMLFTLDADTKYSDESDPLRAIAFRPELVRRLVEARGLQMRTVVRGSWDGTTRSDEFQDLIVIAKPVTTRDRVVAVRRRALRLLRRLRARVSRR